MSDEFSRFHPLVNMSYFILVIGFSMFFMHPICLGISLITGFIYSVFLNGKSALKFNLRFILPMLIITALINPAFNHEGATILMYLSNGNPLTLESIVYGIATSFMLGSVIIWFSCYNTIMTSDKFIYIFGRIIPSMSLIFSMVLRLVPRFKSQLKQISYSLKFTGVDVSSGGVIKRAKNAIMIISIMVTWALENSIETADSMKSRGYGLKGRTAFSIFKFDTRDLFALCSILFCGGITIATASKNLMKFGYFPIMKGVKYSLASFIGFTSYFLLCIIPIIINIWEESRWRHTQLKI